MHENRGFRELGRGGGARREAVVQIFQEQIYYSSRDIWNSKLRVALIILNAQILDKLTRKKFSNLICLFTKKKREYSVFTDPMIAIIKHNCQLVPTMDNFEAFLSSYIMNGLKNLLLERKWIAKNNLNIIIKISENETILIITRLA